MPYLRKLVFGVAVLLAGLFTIQPAGAAPIGTVHAAAGRSTLAVTRSASSLGSFMVNAHSGLCAGIVGESQQIAPVEQRTCDVSGSGLDHSQLWNFQLTADGAGYLLINYHSGFCVEPQGESQSAGVALLQTGCVTSGGNHAEAWNKVYVDDGSGFVWQNYHSRLCAHVVGASMVSGARLDQQPCHYTGDDHSMVWNLE